MQINNILGTDDLSAYNLKELFEEIVSMLRVVYTQSLHDSSQSQD